MFGVICIVVTFLILASTAMETTDWKQKEANVHNVIKHRLERLQSFSKVTRRAPCNAQRLLVITEFMFGNSGNHIVEFTHMVWLADRMDATLVVPLWMTDILLPFNTSAVNAQYCFTLDTVIPKGVTPIEVTSEESYFLFKLFHDPVFAPHLPPLNNATVAELSTHFLRVYAALWGNVLPDVREASEWLITHHLDGGFNFTAIHKRMLDGGCNKILAHVTKPQDFSPAELPMGRSEWGGKLQLHHPLCIMSVDFVHDVQALRHRDQNASRIFVAYDGNGEIESYKKHHAVFSSVLETSAAAGDKLAATLSHVNRKFLDMFVSMQAGLFVQNPRSTFSWQIYLIRTVWGLESVPLLRDNDFYLQKMPEELALGNRTLWVSWLSAAEAYRDQLALLGPAIY